MSNEEKIDYSQDIKEIETFSAKCSSCGSTMSFHPETQSLRCEHCGTVVEIEKDFNYTENDILEGFERAEEWDSNEQATYRCGNCGANILLSVDEEASSCPFCGATHIAKEGSFKSIKPHAVIPFQFGAEEAKEKSKKWAKKRIFAPRSFKKSIVAENIKGVYEPCFTFDSSTQSYYEGRVGDRRTRTVGSGKNRRTETYVVYRRVRGNYNRLFDDVLVATNENFTQRHLDDLAPFHSDKACVYEKKYLSGYVANGYQKNLKDSWNDAKRIIDSSIRQGIINSLHCDVVDYLNVSTSHHDVKFKYLLLPIYTLIYRFKKKSYTVRVNGCSGKVKGKTPLSPFRVALASILGLAAAIFFIWLIANYS